MQSFAIEACGNDRDVVWPALFIGTCNEPVAEHGGIRLGACGLFDVSRARHTRKSIAAHDQHVAQAKLLVCEIDLDGGLGAERLQDDVASLARFGLFLGNLACVHQALHQRLVTRQQNELVVTKEICAAVAHLRDVHRVPEQPRDGAVVPMPRCCGFSFANV